MTKKRRTEPPKLDDGQAEVPESDSSVQFVTVTLPIGRLSDGNEYQASRHNPPRQLRGRRLEHRQGLALGAVRLGMIATGATFDVPRRGFATGIERRKAIETKEEVVAKILELVAEAINNQAGD